jgi:membrane-bound lytic murein transglycosylase F
MAINLNKKNFLIIIASVSIIVVFLLWLANNKPPGDWKEISKEGRITVAIEKSFFGLTNDSNGIAGFQYELLKAFADSMQLELVVVEESNLQKAVDRLIDGDCDIVASFVPLGAFKDTTKIAYTHAFQRSRLILVQNLVLQDSNLIRKQYDLANDSIYVAQGSRYVRRLQNLSNEIASDIHIFEVKNKSNDELLAMVASGEYSKSVLLENRVKHFSSIYTELDFSLPLSLEQEQVWMVRKSSPVLLEKLNAFYAEFLHTFAYLELYAKYYN